ncbi:MAG: hypothetical protein ACTSRC_20800 [Candidatus Helarchaeota archaeon]
MISRVIEFLNQQLYLETDSETISKYITMEYRDYFTSKIRSISAWYFPLEKVSHEKLKFPVDAKLVQTNVDGRITFKDGKYYGLYHGGSVKGVYNTKSYKVTNLIQNPSRYFNICVGIIDYLFSKILLHDAIFRIHAACVSKADEVLLICGKRGTGKTTLLMKFLRNGFEFIADDSTFIRLEKDQLICYPFPKTIKINYEDIEKFPELYNSLEITPVLTSHGHKKAIISPKNNHFPIQTRKRPVSRIIVPNFSTALTTTLCTVHPLTPKEQTCVIDIVKQNLKFDLLLSSFQGKDLLNIDYLQNDNLLKRQERLCQKTIELYPITTLNMGGDFASFEIDNLSL